jgi:RNA recognition motif 2/RNA recognition motif. (a.k.a. RRM, RBD, or RNP domain)
MMSMFIFLLMHIFYKNTFISVADDPPEMNFGEFQLQRAHSTPSTLYSTEGSVDENYRTTCMLRNLPNKYDINAVLDLLNTSGFSKCYDFFYLPIDWRNLCNVGYAFVNFRHHIDAVRFFEVFTGFRFPSINSRKICEVCWANVQGRTANVDHYRNSPILEKFRPLLFDGKGNLERFPEPDPEVSYQVIRDNPLKSVLSIRGPDTHKIFVGGLSKSSTADSIVHYFSKFGSVKDASVVIDRTSGKSRGFGFCLFDSPVPWTVLVRKDHVIDGAVVAVKKYQHITL